MGCIIAGLVSKQTILKITSSKANYMRYGYSDLSEKTGARNKKEEYQASLFHFRLFYAVNFLFSIIVSIFCLNCSFSCSVEDLLESIKSRAFFPSLFFM